MFKPVPKAAPAKASDDPILADLESDSPTPVFTSYVQPKKKVSGALVALLVLVLAGGGLYAAWMYQPGLREMAQPQIDRLMALIGRPSADQTAAAPRAAATPLPAKGPAPQTATTTAWLNSDAAATPAAASTLSPTPAATDTASSLVAPTATSIPVPAASKSEAPIESKKNVAAAVPSDTELPG